MKRILLYLTIALICVIVSGNVSARKRETKPVPEWQSMSRNEHIAYLSLTPKTKPVVREYMQNEISRISQIVSPVQTIRDSLIVGVELPVSRFFAANDTVLSAEGVQLLKYLLPVTRRYDYRILVSVHTADAGSPEYLSHFSQLRADAISKCLYESAENIPIVMAYGVAGDEPISKNTTFRGRMNNRRVEILFIPSDDLITRLIAQK